jgi:hypothetical protein
MQLCGHACCRTLRICEAEFAVKNHDKLMGELLKATQKGLVGEYMQLT